MGDPRMAMREFLTPEQRELYIHNAWFRQGLDTLAQLVPTMIAGLEVQADEKNVEMQRAMKVIMEANPFPTPEQARKMLEGSA